MQSMLIAFRTVLANFQTACLIFLVFLRCVISGEAFCTDQSNLISHFQAPFARTEYTICANVSQSLRTRHESAIGTSAVFKLCFVYIGMRSDADSRSVFCVAVQEVVHQARARMCLKQALSSMHRMDRSLPNRHQRRSARRMKRIFLPVREQAA